MTKDKDQKPHFDVHPSVVYQLGESLISNAIQALVELIKNCYDADATYAKVTIDTKGTTEVPNAIYPPSGGLIIVEDDGFGMNFEAVEFGWLMISNRNKLELKEAKKTTPGGRTPLGDKGLGRLGVQRLGENLEIFTKCAEEHGYHFGFSWLDFATAPTLKDVDIHLAEVDYPHPHGTKVVVSGLQEIATWLGQDSIKRLEQGLSEMISPYRQIRDFSLFVEVDGKTLDLVEISNEVRSLAPVRYNIDFDGNRLKITGKARLDLFRPQTQKDVDLFATIVESDDGRTFFEYLQDQKLAKDIGLSRSASKHWFVEFRYERGLDELDKVKHDDTRGDAIANPGPFNGEVDSFDLGPAAFKQQSVFDRISDYRRHIKDLSGIRVYRDGFAIRVDHDWLKLGAQWTGARSYYGLKPDTTLGYIALAARNNMDLEETTDREGFKITPYYENFYALLSEFREFTMSAHGFFGRSWVEFRKKRNEELAQVDARKTLEDISGTIKKGLADAGTYQKKLDAFRTRLEATASESRSVIPMLTSAKEVTPQLREKIAETLSILESMLDEARSVIDQLSGFLGQIGALKEIGQVLEDRVDGLRRQMDAMYETVALGITAEALSHEVFNVADQLARRTKMAETQLRSKGMADRPILAFIEYVHTSVMALRKQMSFLSPSLQFVREQKDMINVSEFLNQMAEFYQDRLSKNDISLFIHSSDNEQLLIRMNRGKLSQILDNFLLNSEYWLKEDIVQKRLTKGMITFEVNRPFIRIFDNGRGIDSTVENTLFEPFVSAKAKGQGRGLGLFIVKQLLDSEGCSVGVLPERNRYHRFFKFQVDLRGAINE